MSTDFLRSPKQERVRSPLQDFDRGTGNPASEGQWFHLQKTWPGIRALALSGFPAVGSVPSVEQDLRFRARWNKKITSSTWWYDLFPGDEIADGVITKTAVDQLAGAGYCPSTDGGSPTNVDIDHKLVGSSPLFNNYHPYQWGAIPDYLWTITNDSDTHSSFYLSDTEKIVQNLSEPIAFADMLSSAIARINPLDFDNPAEAYFGLGGETEWGPEYPWHPDGLFHTGQHGFNEWRTGLVSVDTTGLNPASYTGADLHAPINFQDAALPGELTNIASIKSANDTAIGGAWWAARCSYWWYPIHFEYTNRPPNIYIYNTTPWIDVRKCRFRVGTETPIPYFICRGHIMFNWAAGTYYVHDHVDLIQVGAVTRSSPVVIPMPHGESFVDFQTVGSGPSLSVGAINFAIIGEGINAWKARTGFTLI